MPRSGSRKKAELSEIDKLILEVMKEYQGGWLRPVQIVEYMEDKYGREFNASYIRRRLSKLAREGKIRKFGSLYSYPFPEGLGRYYLVLYKEDVEFLESLRTGNEELYEVLHRVLTEYKTLKNAGGVAVGVGAHVKGEG